MLFTVTSTNKFYSTPPPPHPWAKVVWNWFVMQTLYTETSSLRTLNLMPKTSTKLSVHEFSFWTCLLSGPTHPLQGELLKRWTPFSSFFMLRFFLFIFSYNHEANVCTEKTLESWNFFPSPILKLWYHLHHGVTSVWPPITPRKSSLWSRTRDLAKCNPRNPWCHL